MYKAVKIIALRSWTFLGSSHGKFYFLQLFRMLLFVSLILFGRATLSIFALVWQDFHCFTAPQKIWGMSLDIKCHKTKQNKNLLCLCLYVNTLSTGCLRRPLADPLHLPDCVLPQSSLALAMHVRAMSLLLTPLFPWSYFALGYHEARALAKSLW